MNHTSSDTAQFQKHSDLNTKMSVNIETVSDTDDTVYCESYFDALYKDNTDPWQYQTRWYEKRKREMCLAVLPQDHYGSALELGCGNGVFSKLLASRCGELLSIDGNEKAVQLAKQHLSPLPHVTVVQGVIPSILTSLPNDASSSPSYDLIAISEILYYLSPTDIDTVIDWTQKYLTSGGSILFCHWRYPIDGFSMTGNSVHQRVHKAFDNPDFTHQSKVIDSDFLLDVWQRLPYTVAMQENLV